MPRNSLPSQHANISTKFRGLGRLQWYYTPCSKQCRDENAFKQHTLSKSRVHNIDAISLNVNQAVKQYSQQFKSDFLNLLHLNHLEKSVQVLRFYQAYISNRDHVHLNVTRWDSLTDFTKWLGQEGLCQVEEKNDGIYIAWINTSPNTLQRTIALNKKDREEAARQRQEDQQVDEQLKGAYAQAKHSSHPSSTKPAPLAPTPTATLNSPFN
ncbi:domain of Kin17 curved DNA-binding protein-domain-containing protein [Diaporthe sp. PMI_573]|nr:domain of Kin17 curved DNA-binding protein-domain-containing protein [Diaporthaceae sp. PMI_573]